MNFSIIKHPFFPFLLITLFILELIIFKNNYRHIITMINNDRKNVKKGFFLFIASLLFSHAIYTMLVFFTYQENEEGLTLSIIIAAIFIVTLFIRSGIFVKDIADIANKNN